MKPAERRWLLETKHKHIENLQNIFTGDNYNFV